MKTKRKPPIGNDKQTHVRISCRAHERLEECFKVSVLKTRQALLDSLIESYSIRMDVEPMLQKRWRKDGKRRLASKKRRSER